jgi:hypothetical protein
MLQAQGALKILAATAALKAATEPSAPPAAVVVARPADPMALELRAAADQPLVHVAVVVVVRMVGL